MSISNVTIDEDDYKAILKIVQDRAKKNKLTIDLTANGGKVNVPDGIILENLNVLHIIEKIGGENENNLIADDDSFDESHSDTDD